MTSIPWLTISFLSPPFLRTGEIDGLDDKLELAHHVMLVNPLRLLGNDGLYSESKISLETLLTRRNSDSWGEYLGLASAVIG